MYRDGRNVSPKIKKKVVKLYLFLSHQHFRDYTNIFPSLSVSKPVNAPRDCNNSYKSIKRVENLEKRPKNLQYVKQERMTLRTVSYPRYKIDPHARNSAGSLDPQTIRKRNL